MATRTITRTKTTTKTQEPNEKDRKCIDCSAVISASEPAWKVRCIKCYNLKKRKPVDTGHVLGTK